MNPAEKLALRLLKRHKLTPPFDLVELVKKYAEVEYLPFPANADGIVIGPKARKQPIVFINSDIPGTRQHFTLAHELGHIIIPWHTGNIVSHTAHITDASTYLYRELETEANRFAAELLMPSEWIKTIHKETPNSSFESFFKRILRDSKASRDAALIKVFRCIPSGYICAETDDEFRIIKTLNSPRTFTRLDEEIYANQISFENSEIERFPIGDKVLFVWKISESRKLPKEEDSRAWRDIIKSILNETGLQGELMSINAILAASFHSNKDKSDQEIFYAIKYRYSKRPEIEDIVNHPSFDQYIIKRIEELKARRKS